MWASTQHSVWRGGGEGLTSNIPAMAVTRDVSKLSGWLNARAPPNMPVMSVTLEVSQLEMSALKVGKL